MSKVERIVEVTAKASSGGNATSGKIYVKTNGINKTIPAVVFSTEKANKLLDFMEKANTSASTKFGKKR